MFKVAVGHGLDPDSSEAIAEALEHCQQTLGNDVPQAGILLASIDFDHSSVLQYIRKIYPDLLLIGGTSVGEMSSILGFQQDSLTLMLFCSDEVTFTVGVGHNADEDTNAAAIAAMNSVLKTTSVDANGNAPTKVRPPEELKLCYTLCEGLTVDGAALVKSLRAATNHTVPIFGGFTGDDYHFTATYQFIGDQVVQNAVVILAFFGNLKVSYGVAAGQNPIGRKATVTKSNNHIVHEIDGQPAKYFYADYAVPEAAAEFESKIYGVSSYSKSVAVFEPGEQNFYLRSPNGEANQDGSLNFFSHVPEQSTIQLADSDRESLVSSAEDAFSKARSTYPGEEPDAVLLISCVARMKNLGTQVDREYRVVEKSLGNQVPNMGFYSYGEISPFSEQLTAYFHNETFIALLIGTR